MISQQPTSTLFPYTTLFRSYKVKINYVSPEILRMPKEVMNEVSEKGIPQAEFNSLENVLPETDVLYVTRVQKERRSEEHTSELQSLAYLVCRLLLEKKNKEA